MMSLFARRVRASTLFFAFAAAGCSAAGDATGVAAKHADRILVVQGADQTAQAGRDLSQSVLFRVLDSSGAGMPGVTVSLSVVSGGGLVTPASDTTDSHGEFKAKWTLGQNGAEQVIAASTPGVPATTVRAIAIFPARIVIVQGHGQTAKAGAAVVNPVIVRVVSENNVPMQGVTVGFQLTGGGAMAPATVVTNALGEATTKWTMGPAGTNTVIAIAGSLTSPTITATATP
jgi:hypothetical protein